MKTDDLRKEIHRYIDTTDGKMLKVVHTILEEHAQLYGADVSDLKASEIDELDKRWNDYKKGLTKTHTADEVRREIRKKLKAIKR